MLYPVYALLFADAGLSTSQISTLFVIWSVVSFVFEVPTGALADAWSRRGLYAIGQLLIAAGYALWLIWPAFPGFALGFVLWGVGGAFCSGTLEALVYELAGDDYAKIMGRAGTVGILAMTAAALLATPAFTLGGYRLVGIASIAMVTLSGLLALRLPDSTRTREEADDSSDGSFRKLLRSGLRESVRNRHMALAVAVAALVPGFTALDEYLPLLAREKGAPTAGVPLLYALTALAMAAGSALAGRYAVSVSGAVAAAAALLAAGALIPHLAGMVAVSAAFGLLQLAMIRAETHLQEAITGPARGTVLSVSGFAAEVFAVLLYAGFAVPAPLPMIFALAALPLLITAGLEIVRRG